MTEFRRLPALVLSVAFAASMAIASRADAFFADGEGHYALRGVTETEPAFSHADGTFQAIEQSFRLQGEARFNDFSSMFLEFRLFDNPRAAYLGDKAQPRDQMNCDNGVASDNPNAGDKTKPLPCNHQNSGEPGYKPYTPQVTKAYVRYAFDYCLLEAGRRGRDWGLGIFLDSGVKPFDTDASVFDGVTCNINLQKTQTLGLSVGYDKLAESGSYINVGSTDAMARTFGANDSGDDLDQFFFTIEYDDRKANAGSPFTKQVGVYFAQVSSREIDKGGSSTDLKFLDLYTGFFFNDLSLRNEILFRMGKSGDPNWQAMGGEDFDGGNPAVNKLDSIGLAGALEWTLSRSGAAIGPVEYNKGDATRHVLFFDYAYAPGDSDGYRSNSVPDTDNAGKPAGTPPDPAGKEGRHGVVKAMAFHRNYKPALILFNARPDADRLSVEGAFDASRVEDATVLSAGYRYESMANGSIEAKLITATMNSAMPSDVKDKYTAYNLQNAGATGFKANVPVGYYGKSLGYELDVSYTYKVGREAELGAALAGALPGKAWQVDQNSKPANDFLIQTSAAFHF